jgi:RHH-type proline utilization regulon transcriptional repressor/proline dehydrogenase/delta 1-pyrroline-5-carboxylate dehydrogenase
VIDQGAYDRLMEYRAAKQNRWLHTLPVPGEGLFVPPTMIQADRIEDVTREWFGPLLHVATWPAGQLAETVRRVNGTGFGLTMGLHSRIARAAETVEAAATTGNLYVNRSMIGAIVGSQPFGGEGLSGTGPKAGGPHYLPRFVASGPPAPTRPAPAATRPCSAWRMSASERCPLVEAAVAVAAAPAGGGGARAR